MESDNSYPVKAVMLNMDGGPDIYFQFNPTEIKISRDVSWGGRARAGNQGGAQAGNNDDNGTPDPANPDTGVDIPKYGGTKPYVVSINKVLFDTFEKRTSVDDEYIDNLKLSVTPSVQTTREETTTGRVRYRPPQYLFTFGNRQFDFICAVKSLSWSYTVWDENGTPLRALVNLVLTETTLKRTVQLSGANGNAVRTGNTFTIENSLSASAGLGVSAGISANFGLSAGISLSAGLSGFI